jgi:hypothetical protein
MSLFSGGTKRSKIVRMVLWSSSMPGLLIVAFVPRPMLGNSSKALAIASMAVALVCTLGYYLEYLRVEGKGETEESKIGTAEAVPLQSPSLVTASRGFRAPLRGLVDLFGLVPRVPPALRSGSTLGYSRAVPPGLVNRNRHAGSCFGGGAR